MKYIIPGLPKQQNEFIATPDIAELLFSPIFSRVDEDSFRKNATAFQKRLLDKCPLVGGYKNLVIDSYTQFLYPGMCPVGSRSGMNQLHEWHCDGWDTLDGEATTFHLFETKSEGCTQFNLEEIELNLPDDMRILDFNIEAVKKASSEWGVKPFSMESNKFLTFNRHLHRAAPVTHKQFRYFFRVTESNVIAPDYGRENPRPGNPAFSGSSRRIKNIDKIQNGISIFYEPIKEE